MSWSAYYEATLGKPLHPIYSHLEPHLPDRGTVLELGCGVGHGVQWFAAKGFHVVANDAEEEALRLLKDRLAPDADVQFLPGKFEEIDLPESDVVVAGFSLFFLDPPTFAAFWPRLVAAIRPGGLFAGQFLGPNDDWVDRGYSFHSAEELDLLLDGFDILLWEEAERDGETSLKEPKHWHVFHVVARKLRA